jgi:hypothetical protein
MCIMASPVQSVHNTKIFAGFDTAKSRQALVYEMSVQLAARSGKGNAMILPVPVGDKGHTAIELIDMSSVPKFFEPLEELFVVQSRGFSMNSLSKGLSEPLEVRRVGNYDVSIVPTVDDVKRLNQDVFEVSQDTEFILRENYPVGFAFVVAQLQKSGDFHPLAYTHPLIGDRLFIPTRHGHGGPEDLPKWDHHIFHQSNKELDVRPRDNRNTTYSKTDERADLSSTVDAVVKSGTQGAYWLAAYIQRVGPLTRIQAHGRLPNIDLTVPV